MKKVEYLEKYGLTDSAELEVNVSEVGDTRVQRAILRVIAFWYPKAKTMRHGERWLIRSADEFIYDDGIFYKHDTIWRTVRQLGKDGWLICERHFHPYDPTPGPVNWIRPTVIFIDDMGKKAKQMLKEQAKHSASSAQYK
jgi:hypothetical protein